VFEAENVPGMCVMHVSEPPPTVSSVATQAIPPALDEVLLACLQKDPRDRPADANEFWRRLGAVELDQPWTQERAEAWWRENLPELA
jgi:serine/threonine-protein kinase